MQPIRSMPPVLPDASATLVCRSRGCHIATITVLLVLGVAFSSASAQEWYDIPPTNTIHVDDDASGTENGTPANPYATVDKAIRDNSFGPGTQVVVHAGSYSPGYMGNDNINGTANAPITFVGALGETRPSFGPSQTSAANWVAFKNIHFRAGSGSSNAVNIDDASDRNDPEACTNIAFVGCSFEYSDASQGNCDLLKVPGCNYVRVIDCVFDGGGYTDVAAGSGIDFTGVHGAVVTGCEFKDFKSGSNASCVQFKGMSGYYEPAGVVYNNWFHDISVDGRTRGGDMTTVFNLGCGGVTWNDSQHCGACRPDPDTLPTTDGLSIARGILVYGNLLERVGKIACFSDSDETILANNTAYDVYGFFYSFDAQGNGSSYFDDNTNMLIANNVTYFTRPLDNNDDIGSLAWQQPPTTTSNYWFESSGSNEHLPWKYGGLNGLNWDNDYSGENPVFAGAGIGNYRLTTASPPSARTGGASGVLPAGALDLDGVAYATTPSLGAYQFDDGNPPPPPACLRVTSVNPANGQELQDGAPIILSFNQGANRSSIEANLSIVGSATGSFSLGFNWSSDFLVSVSLSLDPTPGETIDLTLLDGAQSQAGGVLDGDDNGTCGGDYAVSFTTADSGPGPDLVAPAGVDDLQLIFDSNNGAAILRWTAPADDGPQGRPETIWVRYATDPFSQGFDWASAIEFGVQDPPLAPGQTQTLTLGYIDASNGTLMAAMRTVDAAGNVSLVSNVARDEMAPSVYAETGSALSVIEGTQSVVRCWIVDQGRGNGRAVEGRLGFDSTAPSDGTVLSAQSVLGYDGSDGRIEAPIDARTWTAGESHRLRVEGRDDAGNWSNEIEITLNVESAAIGCLSLVDVQPGNGTRLPRAESFLFTFDRDLDVNTITPAAFDITFESTDEPARSVAVDVALTTPSTVTATLVESIEGLGTLTVALDPDISGTDGTLLAGDGCTAPDVATFEIDPDVGSADCVELVASQPAPDTRIDHDLSVIALSFTTPLDPLTVDPSTVWVELRRTAGGSEAVAVDFAWMNSALLELRFQAPITEPAEVILHLDSSVRSAEGAPLGQGASCAPVEPLSFFVRLGGIAVAGSELDRLNKGGLVAVSGYQVVFTDLTPGAALRVYDTTGWLVHQARIDTDSYTLETSSLGTFPNKQFIVLYRDYRQHIVAGRDVGFYRSYLGDLE